MKKKQLREFYDNWYLPEEEAQRRKKIVDDFITNQNNPVWNEARKEFDLINNYVNLAYLLSGFKPVQDNEIVDFINAIFIIGEEPGEDELNEFVKLAAPGFQYLFDFADTDFHKQLLLDNEIVGDESIQIAGITVPISKDAIKLHLERINYRVFSEEDIADVQNDFIDYKLKQYDKFNKSQSSDESNQTNGDIVEEGYINKSESLRSSLDDNSFFELEKMKTLTPDQRLALIKLIVRNDLPYQVAMLQHVGFIDFFFNEYCKTKTELYEKLSKLLNRPARSIAGNIRSFNEQSRDRQEFTAYQKDEEVARDFNRL